MKKIKFKYQLKELTRRLLDVAASQRSTIAAATISSIIGNVARMGLMGFGASLILFSAGKTQSGSYLIWGGLVAFCAVLIAVMRYVEGVTAHVAAYTLLAEMRTDFFHKLRELAPACTVDKEKGDIISIAIADIDTIEKFFAHTIGPMFTVILLPCLTLIYAATIDWIFVAVLLPVYIIISVIVPLIGMKTGRRLGQDYRNEIGSLKSLILESVYGLKDIQIFEIGEKRWNLVKDKSSRINKIAHGLTLQKQMVNSLPHFFIYLSRILITFSTALLMITEEQKLNEIIILSFIVSASFSSTQSLISVVSSLLETFAASERLFTIYDEKPAVNEIASPVQLLQAKDIHFKNLSFRYNKDSNYVLKDIETTFKSGEKIGIVGESGVGKSTIMRLLLRFWDPSRGAILLDQTPISELSFHSLRERIALVEQHTFIYDDTAAANIALGRPNATLEEIKIAARRAGIDHLIESLPDAYETRLGEFGSRLSGGERQRIGIARIMLADPDIIIMDEPTSSLDIFHEKILLKTLEDEYQDKTVILVSHRKSTLTVCDRIFKLQNGELIEQLG